ncbi:MAG TPA: hypothetical protein VL096_18815 [Pirellulaceae bacterium]|nr:hypothetical protein [Pirellulaceae bacterium]
MAVLWAASLWQNQLTYLFPLVVSISLVYGATRHEAMGPILANALHTASWILGFMAVIFAILVGVNWLT